MLILKFDDVASREIAKVATDDDVLVEIKVVGKKCLEFRDLTAGRHVACPLLHSDGELGAVHAASSVPVAVVVGL